MHAEMSSKDWIFKANLKNKIKSKTNLSARVFSYLRFGSDYIGHSREGYWPLSILAQYIVWVSSVSSVANY